MTNFNILDENNPIIPFTSDYGFKVTFGNESNTLFLKKALQALIASPTPIKEITFDKNTFEGITKTGRSGIFDMSCLDENNEHYIIEMQLAYYADFFQRLKYYGFHKMNTLVRKGDFQFDNLNKIYCIAILAHSITNFPYYHNICTIKNQNGELIDDQLTYIIVELDKFKKKAENCISDLDKLLYTMKEAHLITDPSEKPIFLDEDWIKSAVEDLESRRLSPEDREIYEKIIVHNAVAIRAEKKRIEAAVKEGIEEGIQEAVSLAVSEAVEEVTKKIEKEIAQRVEKETAQRVEKEMQMQNIKMMLQLGKFTVAEIADIYKVSFDFVENIKKEIRE